MCELAYSKATDRPARWVLAVPEDSKVQCAADLAGALEGPHPPMPRARPACRVTRVGSRRHGSLAASKGAAPDHVSDAAALCAAPLACCSCQKVLLARQERGVNVKVEYSWGATEVKASLPGVGGIVDITETGSSLRANKLRVRAPSCWRACAPAPVGGGCSGAAGLGRTAAAWLLLSSCGRALRWCLRPAHPR